MNEEIKLSEEQLDQLAALHAETGVSYSQLINSAIDEYFNNFMAELRRLEIKKIK